jgi:hypothetical protein
MNTLRLEIEFIARGVLEEKLRNGNTTMRNNGAKMFCLRCVASLPHHNERPRHFFTEAFKAELTCKLPRKIAEAKNEGSEAASSQQHRSLSRND